MNDDILNLNFSNGIQVFFFLIYFQYQILFLDKIFGILALIFHE